MVFASTCEHASSVFIFASTSSDQICFASTLKTSYGEQRALRKFFWAESGSLYWKKRFAPWNLADTVQPIPAFYSYVLAMVSNYAWYLRLCFSAVHQVNAQGNSQLSSPTLWTAHHRKKLKVTRLTSVVTRKVFGYINILRKCELRGILYSMIGKPIQTGKYSTQRKLFSVEASRI